MYRPPGLTHPQLLALYEALRTPHAYTVTAQMYDLDNVPFQDLPPIVGGTLDGKGPTRSLDVTFADPGRTMRTVEGINAAHFLIRVNYVVTVPGITSPVVIPVCTGAVDTCVRSDMTVTVTARSKTMLHTAQAGERFTVPKGVARTEAIKRLAVQAGESRALMDIPDRPFTLRADETVDVFDTWWEHEKELAQAMNLMLFYNPEGRLVARPAPTGPSFTFGSGEGGWFTADGMPQVTADFREFHNEIWYYYGDRKTPPVIVSAPPNHPLSKESLAWRGMPRRRILRTPLHAHIKRRDEASHNAHDLLDRELLHVVRVTAKIFPFPFMEVGDLYRFDSTDYSDITTCDWTLDFAPGGAMTVGWNDYRNRGLAR